MRITDVETIMLRLPSVADVCDGSQDAFVVRIHTDAGIVGLGEADSMPTILKAIFDAPPSNSIGHGLRDLLLGQDPRQIDVLFKRLLDRTLYMQGSGLRLTAISAVEMALWDIAGKAAGAPVSQLLGGAFRQRVRAYASVLFPEDPSDLASVRETGKRLAQRGFGRQVRMGRLRSRLARRHRARKDSAPAIGDDTDLLIDVGLCWNARTALERAHMLAEFRLYWLEAPLPFYPMEAYAELCLQSPIQISCESAGGYRESQDAIRRGKLHVILPDVSNVGGVGEWKRISQMARVEGARCVCIASAPEY